MGVGAGKSDSTREAIADRIHSAAGTIREQATAGSQAFTAGAESVATKLDASASYIASRDGRKMMGDVLAVVKRYPAQSLLVAGFIGFMVARVLRSD